MGARPRGREPGELVGRRCRERPKSTGSGGFLQKVGWGGRRVATEWLLFPDHAILARFKMEKRVKKLRRRNGEMVIW